MCGDGSAQALGLQTPGVIVPCEWFFVVNSTYGVKSVRNTFCQGGAVWVADVGISCSESCNQCVGGAFWNFQSDEKVETRDGQE